MAWTTPHKVFTLRIPPGLHRRIKAAADSDGVTVNAYITEALRTTAGDDPAIEPECPYCGLVLGDEPDCSRCRPDQR